MEGSSEDDLVVVFSSHVPIDFLYWFWLNFSCVFSKPQEVYSEKILYFFFPRFVFLVSCSYFFLNVTEMSPKLL